MSKQFTKVNGLSIRARASAPADIANGDIYYNTTTNTFRQYVNGAESDIGSGAAAITTGLAREYWGAAPAPSGYVLASGNTIGNASSNATERANADTSALFTLLWNATTNSQLQLYNSSGSPISRGGSAASDFAANAALALPDKRGRVSIGKDNMGGTTASRITSGGSGITGTTLMSAGGVETYTLSTPEMPSHSHPISDGGHSHTVLGFYQNNVSPQPASRQGIYSTIQNQFPGAVTGPVGTGITTTTSTGGGGAHNNVQPLIVCNYIIKL